MPNLSRTVRAGILGSIVCSFAWSVARGQALPDWTIHQPSSSLEIARVAPFALHSYNVELRNISAKTIVGIAAVTPSSTPDRNTISVTTFDNLQVIKPGSSVTLILPTVPSPSRNEDRERYEVHIAAITFADGSSEGSKQDLELMIDEYLGCALEMKRVADLLAAMSTPENPTAADLDALTKSIGALSPHSAEGAVGPVRGVTLPGVPQSFVDAGVARLSAGVHLGINNAREQATRDLDRVWLVFDPAAETAQAGRARDWHFAPLSLAAMREKYRVLSEKQILILRAFAVKAQ